MRMGATMRTNLASAELAAIVARKGLRYPEIEAAWLSGEIETRPTSQIRVNRHQWRLEGRFTRRRRPQRSPDKQKSYERRHRLAFSGPMPFHLAARFTVGDMAVMRIVADEHRTNGWCDASMDEIAARAGVCRKTVRRAMRHAQSERLITIEERPVQGRKHLPNIVRIVSREWLAWLARGPTCNRPIGGHSVATTDNSKKVVRGIRNEKERREQCTPHLPATENPSWPHERVLTRDYVCGTAKPTTSLHAGDLGAKGLGFRIT